ncbi:hypothetical protein FACS1894170_09090 [Planctomycetales bacterium]|nr:hypothetical protein FACS1894170_09090 [Planctomycetales bacterium]
MCNEEKVASEYVSVTRRSKGVILFFVSIVIAMLAGAGVMLVHLTNTDNQTAGLHSDRIQCDQLVLSGIAYLQTVEKDKAELDKNIEVFPNGYFIIKAVSIDSLAARFQIYGIITGSTVTSRADVVIDYSQKPPKVVQCVFQ